jgi:hypothetical protein
MRGVRRAGARDRPRCGRAGAWNAARSRAAKSTKVDFVTFQPRFQPPQTELADLQPPQGRPKPFARTCHPDLFGRVRFVRCARVRAEDHGRMTNREMGG